MIFESLIAAVALLGSTEAPCPHPRISAVLEIGDIVYDPHKPPAVGEPAGDGICELYCGLQVVDQSEWIPQCSTYSCKFTLQGPDGATVTHPIVFGPWFDGMEQPTSVGTVCGGWSESMAAGRYHATLECEASTASFDFEVDRSHPTGFEIPAALWRESNHCPSNPRVR